MNRESSFGMPSQRNGMEMCCGRCVHHRRGDGRYNEEWICLCDTSSYYLDETRYRDCCGEFEPKGQKRF